MYFTRKAASTAKIIKYLFFAFNFSFFYLYFHYFLISILQKKKKQGSYMASGKKNYFRHYLYIISEEIDSYCNSYSGFIKIGITANPRERIKALQCSNPRGLKFQAVYGFNYKFQAVVFEAGLHSLLRHHAAKNEWFYWNAHTEKWVNKIKEANLSCVTGEFL